VLFIFLLLLLFVHLILFECHNWSLGQAKILKTESGISRKFWGPRGPCILFLFFFFFSSYCNAERLQPPLSFNHLKQIVVWREAQLMQSYRPDLCFNGSVPCTKFAWTLKSLLLICYAQNRVQAGVV
jgi:hypothetical protein